MKRTNFIRRTKEKASVSKGAKAKASPSPMQFTFAAQPEKVKFLHPISSHQTRTPPSQFSPEFYFVTHFLSLSSLRVPHLSPSKHQKLLFAPLNLNFKLKPYL